MRLIGVGGVKSPVKRDEEQHVLLNWPSMLER
jgi:hypothetical protein